MNNIHLMICLLILLVINFIIIFILLLKLNKNLYYFCFFIMSSFDSIYMYMCIYVILISSLILLSYLVLLNIFLAFMILNPYYMFTLLLFLSITLFIIIKLLENAVYNIIKKGIYTKDTLKILYIYISLLFNKDEISNFRAVLIYMIESIHYNHYRDLDIYIFQCLLNLIPVFYNDRSTIRLLYHILHKHRYVIHYNQLYKDYYDKHYSHSVYGNKKQLDLLKKNERWLFDNEDHHIYRDLECTLIAISIHKSIPSYSVTEFKYFALYNVEEYHRLREVKYGLRLVYFYISSMLNKDEAIILNDISFVIRLLEYGPYNEKILMDDASRLLHKIAIMDFIDSIIGIIKYKDYYNYYEYAIFVSMFFIYNHKILIEYLDRLDKMAPDIKRPYFSMSLDEPSYRDGCKTRPKL